MTLLGQPRPKQRTSPAARNAASPINPPDGLDVVHATHGNAVIETRATPASLGVLLGGHILQDGEIVLLILKPSLWFVVLSALRFCAVVLILLFAAMLLDQQLPGDNKPYIEFAILLLAGRVMWAMLQWMGRLYILTDLRIVRLSGVFNVNIFDCPLRKVARTRMNRPVGERIFGLGSIEIHPCSEIGAPVATWQTVAHPYAVHDQIVAAINRLSPSPSGHRHI